MSFAAFRQRVMWDRRSPEICRLCGDSLNTPGDYRVFEGRILTHWDCWESLPECAYCGKGSLRLCNECIAKR